MCELEGRCLCKINQVDYVLLAVGHLIFFQRIQKDKGVRCCGLTWFFAEHVVFSESGDEDA